ncbi:MAG: RNA polymerase sigma factor [Phycisphaerae bacterium]
MSVSEQKKPEKPGNESPSAGTPLRKDKAPPAEDLSHLAALLRTRDRRALGLLAERFGRVMVRVAAVRLGDPESARDVAQDALLAAWRSGPKLQDPRRMRSWLFAILLNQCRRHQRSVLRRLGRSWRAWQVRRQHDPDRVGRIDALQEAIGRLDEQDRTLLALRFEQALSVAETARLLGLAEGTVKSRTHRALTRLRAIMETQDQ